MKCIVWLSLFLLFPDCILGGDNSANQKNWFRDPRILAIREIVSNLDSNRNRYSCASEFDKEEGTEHEFCIDDARKIRYFSERGERFGGFWSTTRYFDDTGNLRFRQQVNGDEEYDKVVKTYYDGNGVILLQTSKETGHDDEEIVKQGLAQPGAPPDAGTTGPRR